MRNCGAASQNRKSSPTKSFALTNPSRECRPKLIAFKRNDGERLTDLVGRRNELCARHREVEDIVISTDNLGDDRLRGCFEQLKAIESEVARLNERIAAVQAALLDY